MENTDKTVLCQTTPASFIDRYCSKLNINTELTKVCKFIAIRIQRNNLIPENTPHSIAAGIVYFVSQVCNINVSKREVSNISEISEVTINKCYKKLEEMSDQLMPKPIVDKYNSGLLHCTKHITIVIHISYWLFTYIWLQHIVKIVFPLSQ